MELIKKMGEESRAELKERIDKKLETAGEKRELQLGKVQERIRQHVRCLNDALFACSSLLIKLKIKLKIKLIKVHCKMNLIVYKLSYILFCYCIMALTFIFVINLSFFVLQIMFS